MLRPSFFVLLIFFRCRKFALGLSHSPPRRRRLLKFFYLAKIEVCTQPTAVVVAAAVAFD